MRAEGMNLTGSKK